jgi:hypothetical protein
LPALNRPHIGDRPLLWKEMYLGGASLAGPPPGQFLRTLGPHLAVIASAFLGLSIAGHLLAPDGAAGLVRHLYQPLARVAGIALALAWCVGTAFRAADGVSRERDRRTLYGLFTLPVERAAILRAKWLGAILRFRGLGYLLVAVWGVALVTGALHPLGLFLLAVSVAAFLTMLASLATWLSVVCRNAFSARMSVSLLLGVVFAGAWLALVNSPQDWDSVWESDPERWAIHLRQVGLNPLVGWWQAAFNWEEGDRLLGGPGQRLERARLAAVAAGSLIAAALAGVFWIGALQRFRKL